MALNKTPTNSAPASPPSAPPAVSAPETTASETPAAASVPASPVAPPAPVRPAGLPDAFWDAAAGVKVADLVKAHGDLAKAKAEADARMAARPAAPDAYALDLPKDFALPQGVEFKIDGNDPLIGMARELAHAAGLDQAGFSALLGRYAATQLDQHKAAEAAYTAELAKLGDKATARMQAAAGWIDGALPKDQADAVKGGQAWTAAFWQGLETLQQKTAALAPPGNGHAAPAPKDPIAALFPKTKFAGAA